MDAKQKAKELVKKFAKIQLGETADGEAYYMGSEGYGNEIKQCALIAVNFAMEAIADCSVVAGHPLGEYEQIKEEILKL